ncbi:MAG TPA: hypothetical protein VKS79_07305 [Gemmataceae bacterium]|nr:hypothetical protein [Gemmataceae bacterium]
MRCPWHAPALCLLAFGSAATHAGEPAPLEDALPDRAIARLGVMRPRWNYVTAHAFPTPTTLITADDTLNVYYWDLATGRILRHRQFPCADTAWPKFSSDGKLLAARDWGGKIIRRFDPDDGYTFGRELTIPDVDSLWEFDVCPGGTSVAAIAHTKKALAAYLWNRASKDPISLHTEKSYIQPPRFAPTGKLVVAFVDDTPRSWNANSGTPVWTGERAKDVDPTTFCFTPDGEYFLARSSAPGASPIWWNAHTGKLVPAKEIPIDLGPLTRLPIFSASGRTIITVGDGQKIQVRDSKNGHVQKEINNVEGVLGLSPDGRFCAGWLSGGVPQCWDTETGKALWPEIPDRAHMGGVNRVVYSPNGRLLISIGADGEARLWDVASRGVRCKVPVAAASLAAFTPDGHSVVLTTRGEIYLLDAITNQFKRQRCWSDGSDSPDHTVVGLAVYGTGLDCQVLIDHGKGHYLLQCWNVAAFERTSQRSVSSESLMELNARAGSASAGTQLPDDRTPRAFFDRGRRLFTPDGCIYDTQTGQPVVLLRPPPDSAPHHWIGAVKAAQSAGIAVCASLPSTSTEEVQFGAQVQATPLPTLWVIDTEIGRVVQTIQTDSVGRFEVSPNGRWLAMAGSQGVGIWETNSGRCVLSFPQAGVRSLAFAPDSRTLATGLANGTVTIWDVAPTKPQTSGRLSDAELRVAWSNLTGDDAGRAHQALWQLAAARDQATTLLTTQLKSIVSVSDEHLRKLISDLDSNRFATREAASKELSGLGDRALPALRAAKNGRLSKESEWRIDRLLNRRFVPLAIDTVRFLRAIEVLERIGTPEARQLLVKLSEGDPRALETRAAREALERLGK